MNEDLVINEKGSLLGTAAIMTCQKCGGIRFCKNGKSPSGAQRHRCKKCGRDAIFYTSRIRLSYELREVVKQLLKQKVKVMQISRATGISRQTLHDLKKKIIG